MTHLTPQAFVAKWRTVTVTERAGSQSHFNDLCELLGHPRPHDVDPTGEWFAFEKGATRATGGNGFADVWKRDCFAWEYKGPHANLSKAYAQLLNYYGALGNPPILIVSDIQTIELHTHFTNTVHAVHTLTLDDLLQPDKLDLLRQAFTHPDALRPHQSTVQVTEQAAGQFARIAQLLRGYGNDPQAVAHFLIRLLFCLFAEDVGILPPRLFSRLVTLPRQNARQFQAQLRQLFQAMAAGGYFGADTILHVNGGLFDDDAVLLMDGDSLRILGQVSSQDWAAIEPAIFGTLFERGLDPAKRSQQGAHFTSKEDILLIVEPVLLAPLRGRWAAVQAEAGALAAELAEIDAGVAADMSAAARAKRRTARTRARNRLTELLLGFRRELAAMQVLDPACGSGNFLYVALRRLLDLEQEVITFDVSTGGTLSWPLVTPAQLHGIEVNPYAYELAQATIWIGYIQWLRDNGWGLPDEPILKPLDAIKLMDAVLEYDAEGRPVEPEWPAADVIIGNPPFLGGGKIRSELGDKYTEDLFKLYGNRLPNFSDLVCYWFEKARAQIASGKAKRAGLLATNSIRGGANRKVLERIKGTGDIFWAWSDREWLLDGAAVNVSMVGFDDGTELVRVLDGKSVIAINPDLTATLDLTAARLLVENSSIAFQGPSAKGPLDIDEATARRLLKATTNINGRPNSDVVRPVCSAIDITQGPRSLWTIDFGLMTLEEACQFEGPFEYVKQVVYPVRSRNRRSSYAVKWWQYAEARPGMRTALKGKKRYIATPCHSKHRVFIWLASSVLANQATIVFAREDDYFLGVLHSRPHEVWALRQGTSLEDRPRYTPTTTFETYPFPWPPGAEPAGDPRVGAIAEAARELVEKRDRWLNPEGASEAELKKRTLTRLYNERPTWLQLAHERLDAAVLAAYGWPAGLADEELLARLLALNGARAARPARRVMGQVAAGD